MKKIWIMPLLLVLLFSVPACIGNETENSEPSQTVSEETADTSNTADADQVSENLPSETIENGGKDTMMGETLMTVTVRIGDDPVAVEWEDNDSVNALMELTKDGPLTVQMSMYGGFEQVGSLGTSLPRDDVQTTTQAGDIVLYSGDQIVVFYGSNSWAYTRLGRITDKTAEELAELLGNGDLTLTLSMKS